MVFHDLLCINPYSADRADPIALEPFVDALDMIQMHARQSPEMKTTLAIYRIEFTII